MLTLLFADMPGVHPSAASNLALKTQDPTKVRQRCGCPQQWCSATSVAEESLSALLLTMEAPVLAVASVQTEYMWQLYVEVYNTA